MRRKEGQGGRRDKAEGATKSNKEEGATTSVLFIPTTNFSIRANVDCIICPMESYLFLISELTDYHYLYL